jgi:hypothetical protein
MDINDEELFETIYKYVRDLDKELNLLNGEGIFFAPELYIAFGIGKEIMKWKKFIFGNSNMLWGREENLKNGGPTDIIFRKSENNKNELAAVIELKLRDDYFAYEADIEKLLRLDVKNCNKYFCVLLDSFSEDNDKRLTDLETKFKGKLTSIGKGSFETKQNWYKTQVHCILNLYKVENE